MEKNVNPEEILESKKSAIVKKWVSMAAKTYPPDTASFLIKPGDPFANPVGSTIQQALKDIFNHLLAGADRNHLKNSLTPIIKIRAVQQFTPSKAVGFILQLKGILSEELEKELQGQPLQKKVERLNFAIDDLALIGFDIYMECREKLLEIRANEVRNRTFSAFKRAGLVTEFPESGPSLEG